VIYACVQSDMGISLPRQTMRSSSLGDQWTPINLNEYYGTSRRRADTWNRLKNSILQLHNCKQFGFEREELMQLVTRDAESLQQLEVYWAFPGRDAMQMLYIAVKGQNWGFLSRFVTIVARLISTDHYRSYDLMPVRQRLFSLDGSDLNTEELAHQQLRQEKRPYFEVLVVDSLAVETEQQLRAQHLESRRPEDPFVYDIVVASSFEDAIIALALNYNIQSCIIRYSFPFKSENNLNLMESFFRLAGFSQAELMDANDIQRSGLLGQVLRAIKPGLDLYFLSEVTVEEVSNSLHRNFTRCFFGSEDYPEMRLTILKGIQKRYETPFFNALKAYTQQPTGVFHAMPISRSKSISKSFWIKDYGEFYGDRIFLSETSATIGGLDSLLQPTGCLRAAQDLAARAFGSERCLFVSNGTSTANKIVLQGITNPGDIVLIANDSHKSHYYAAVLADVRPVILDAYALSQYSLVGGVSIYNIKRKLLELKAIGQLGRVRALILTNLTFDGVAYDPVRLMSECLAIKPDLIFFYDEAWFAYGIFTPLTRRRSAMFAAATLKARFSSPEYRLEFLDWQDKIGDLDSMPLTLSLSTCLLPDPDLVKIRVYATQSTHKTLTALRQASMIHINDEDYMRHVACSMNDAYLCHTSTSPNYQIIASLDIGRRQMQFEGYELIQKAFELAHIFRSTIQQSVLISRFFRVLEADDMIPGASRASNHGTPDQHNFFWLQLEQTWTQDEFSLDPTRITLDISATGMDGRAFQELLMDRFDIQVNKISFNTVLIIIHIGSTRGMITYLLESLRAISEEFSLNISNSSEAHGEHGQQLVAERQKHHPVPNFTAFHPSFSNHSSAKTAEGNIRAAYYRAKDPSLTAYIMPTEEIAQSIESGIVYVSATMVTPYPPGYPVLIPGQVISAEIIRYIILVRNWEIHGYDQCLGLLVFVDQGLFVGTS
jgi:arginine decarboxylase